MGMFLLLVFTEGCVSWKWPCFEDSVSQGRAGISREKGERRITWAASARARGLLRTQGTRRSQGWALLSALAFLYTFV